MHHLRFARPLAVVLFVVSLLPALASPTVLAQEVGSTPVVVASGLTNPRGMTWGADGTLFVALAGSGGANQATETAPTSDIIGPWLGGPTAAVASIGPDGCPVALATGLPSSADATGGVLGADDIAILGDQLYVSVDGGGPVHGNPDMPSGVYRVLADGTTELVADLSAWVRANPAASTPGDYDPDAAGYGMVADEAAGLLWVVDPNVGQVLSISPDGVISRIADLSSEHMVPTKPVLDPNGGIYVGTLTTVPFSDGAAKVQHVAADGTVTDVWTNLTTVVDVALDAEGNLYALEMSTSNLNEPPFLQPGTGRVVMQTGPDAMEVVADGLMFPIALDLGPDGAFYLSMPAMGANDGSGVIARLGGDEATPAMMGAACAPIAATLFTPAATPAAGMATPIATPVAESMTADTSAMTVTIENFSFTPATLEIPVGTTVTFTNQDSVPHTATADDGSFDTGNLDNGASAEVTFDTPGTYTYVCSYHPNMTGTIVVT